MEIYTDNWFKYIRENVLAEGLRDIGLPEFVIDYIEDAMPNASEKGRMYIANNWKKSKGGHRGAYTIPSVQYEVFSFLVSEYAQYVIQQDSPNKEAGMADIEARTVGLLDINKDINAPREVYDEERIKQNEQVKFVIDNQFERISYTNAFEILKNCSKNKKKKFKFLVNDWGMDFQSEHERYLVEKHFNKQE